jgi:hypothetical protein
MDFCATKMRRKALSLLCAIRFPGHPGCRQICKRPCSKFGQGHQTHMDARIPIHQLRPIPSLSEKGKRIWIFSCTNYNGLTPPPTRVCVCDSVRTRLSGDVDMGSPWMSGRWQTCGSLTGPKEVDRGGTPESLRMYMGCGHCEEVCAAG